MAKNNHINSGDIEMLHRALDSHIYMLHQNIGGYVKQGNTEAILDCNAEIKKYKELKDKVTNLA